MLDAGTLRFTDAPDTRAEIEHGARDSKSPKPFSRKNEAAPSEKKSELLQKPPLILGEYSTASPNDSSRLRLSLTTPDAAPEPAKEAAEAQQEEPQQVTPEETPAEAPAPAPKPQEEDSDDEEEFEDEPEAQPLIAAVAARYESIMSVDPQRRLRVPRARLPPVERQVSEGREGRNARSQARP